MAIQPNILFILVDDLGWRDLSCYGSSFYETPRIDRLATQGMRFTDAYASAPVCSPTRASAMTGKYPATVGITNFISGMGRGKLLSAPYLFHLPLEEHSIAAALREGGYATWHVGKWHLGHDPYSPENHGFDVNVAGSHHGMPQTFFSPYNLPKLENGPTGEYLTDRLTDEAISLVRNRDRSRPFFLNMCHYAVHIPIQAPHDLIRKYVGKSHDLGYDRINPFEVGEYYPCESMKLHRICRRTVQSDPVYAAMIENLDWNTGRLLDALEEEGILDETLVVFASDNGGESSTCGSPTSNAPLAEGKGWMYEGGTRGPLIIRYPSLVRAGSICSVPTTTPDFYPTFLDLARVPGSREHRIDGVSIAGLLRGGTQLDREAIYWHYPHYSNQGGRPACSVRGGNLKLIEFFDLNRVELYDLAVDPGERENLASARPEDVSRLRAALHDWLESSGAQFPEPNPDYRPETWPQ